ncbi:MAG: methyltransferase domain-containing protein [Actinomycetota bacterium]
MSGNPVDDEAVKKHYENLADDYDEFLYWSPDFVGKLTDRIVELLELGPQDRLLDLGGGTGMYSLAILDRIGLEKPITLVDPFPRMLDKVPEDAPIETACAGALDYSERAPRFTKILIKEAVHHVERKRDLFANLYRALEPGGRIVLVHVDPTAVAYPLYEAALDNARNTFADPDEMVALLKDAGFEAEKSQLVYHHEVPTDRYHRMVETGYMSIISNLDDRQREAGLAQMRERHAGMGKLRFPETFSYVLGVKL